MKTKWVLIVLSFAVLAAAAFGGVGEYLSLEYLKQQQAGFQALYTESPLRVISVYFLIYLSVAAFSIPGAAVLTLGCGALFGFVTGTIIGSFASSIGALLAFWIVRLLARDAIQKKFAKQLVTVNQGIKEDGAFYLFGLRLVTVLPFFLVNILMALTPIKSRTFYLVSQVGMLAGTMVYVNAGTRLAEIDSLSGILDPQLLFAFLLLALFPIIARKLMKYLKGRV